MKLDFELAVDDYVEYSYYVFNGRVVWRKKLKYILTGISAFMILIIWFLPYLELAKVEAFTIALTLGPLYLWIIRSKWLTKKLIQRSYKKGNGLNTIGPVSIILEEDKIITNSSIGESKLNWSAFKALVEIKDYFFIFMSKKRAVIIPKRIFLLAQEEHDVKSFIERKLAE